MKILSVNAGSSSLKFQVYQMPEERVIASGIFERIGIEGSLYTFKTDEKVKKNIEINNHEEAVNILIDELMEKKVVSDLNEIEAVGHRVVHGADKYSDSVIITDEVLSDVEEFSALAPLHNPANISGIKAFKKAIPNALMVAVFDTAFHQTIDKEEFLYAVPYEWYTDLKIRKYGFHGTSHKYLAKRASELNLEKVIICHLGNGGSLSAVKDGKCIDTTMGFTPNAGIIMGTRSGDIDATIIEHVMEKTEKTFSEVMNDLNKKSGLLGLSGFSSDSRDIEEAVEKGNERAILAHNKFVKAIAGYIAKYYVLLEGADAIIFSAGIGENSALVRKDILSSLHILGIEIDEDANNTRGEEKEITTSNSKVKAFIIPTDEELMIVKETYKLIK